MATFQDALETWGPATNSARPSRIDAERYCRRLALGHYENFPVTSWLLPRELQQHFFNIYAYCRWADDLADETDSPTRACKLLDWWDHELQACYAGDTRHPVFIALEPTIREFSIPITPFQDLLSAFRQDQVVRQYETFAELQDYCRRSANPVGVLVLSLCRQVTPQTVAWSDQICTGLQLANFWQDVSRDADIGRCYLPRKDRLRFNYSDQELQQRLTTPAFQELMAFQVERARQFLQDGLPLVGVLPPRLRLDIELFARGGLKILDKIEHQRYRVWEQRPKVSKGEFLALFARCWWRNLWRKPPITVGR